MLFSLHFSLPLHRKKKKTNKDNEERGGTHIYGSVEGHNANREIHNSNKSGSASKFERDPLYISQKHRRQSRPFRWDHAKGRNTPASHRQSSHTHDPCHIVTPLAKLVKNTQGSLCCWFCSRETGVAILERSVHVNVVAFEVVISLCGPKTRAGGEGRSTMFVR